MRWRLKAYRRRIFELQTDCDLYARRLNEQRAVVEEYFAAMTTLKRDAAADGVTIERLERENTRSQARVQDLERALRLARRHLDNCPTAVAVAEHTSDKRRDDQ